VQGRLCGGWEGVDAGVRRKHGDEGGVRVQTQVGKERSSGNQLPQVSLAGKKILKVLR